MTEFSADCHSGLSVRSTLRKRQIRMRRASGCRRLEAGQFLESRLGVRMPQAVRLRQTRRIRLTFVDTQLLSIVALRWDQRATTGESVGTIEYRALRVGTKRNHPCLPALGPAVFQRHVIAAVGKARAELDRLLAPQPEHLLKFETHSDVGIVDPSQVSRIQASRLRDSAAEYSIGHTVVRVRPRDDVLAIDLFGPPTQRRQAIFDGADRELCALPVIDERIDVFGFERTRAHSVEAERMQLICDERQYPLTIVLRCKAAVAVALAQLL